MIILKNTTDKQTLYIPRSVIDTELVNDYETENVTITANGEYQVVPPKGKKGLSAVNLDIDVQFNNQDKEVTYNENGEYTVRADEDYTGLGTVNVTVNVDASEYYDQGVVDGIAQQKSKLESISITSNGTYNREDGYNQVTVDVQPNLQTKEVTYNENGDYTVSADNDFDGLDEVKVTVDIDTSNLPFVVPSETRFSYSKFTKFPDNWDWSEFENESDVSYMFSNCQQLQTIPKLPLKPTKMSNVFYGTDAKTVDVSGWDTSNVTSFSSLFDNSSIRRLYGTFDTSKAAYISKMFYDCRFLTDLQEIDASSVTENLGYDFYSPIGNCYRLVNFGGLKGIKKTWYANKSFSLSYDSILNIINGLADGVTGQTLYLSQEIVNELSDDNIAIATNKGWTISPAKTITEPIVVTEMSQIPTVTYRITPKTYDFSQFNGNWSDLTSQTTLLPYRSLYYFEGDLSNTTIASYAFSTPIIPGGGPPLCYVKLTGTSYISDMRGMFSKQSNLTEVDIEDTRYVMDMSEMFYECTNLVSPNASNFNTNSLGYSVDMFNGCSSLESLDLSGWDTSNLVSMERMFFQCTNLKTLNVSGWNTNNLTTVSSAFNGCINLEELDFTGWNFDKVTSINYFCSGCSKLKKITMTGKPWNGIIGTTSDFAGLPENGVFYYNPEYDYSNVIAKLPESWTAIPLS